MRPARPGASDSSKNRAPSTAKRGTIAERVATPIPRKRNSRRSIGMAASLSARNALTEMEVGAGQHQVDEPPHLLIHLRGGVLPVAPAAVGFGVHVFRPRGLDLRRRVRETE